MQKWVYASLACLSIFIATSVSAMVFGGSNLGILGYPKHRCYQPTKPYDLSDRYAVDRYNSDLDQYVGCIREYVDNARNDMERIRELANEAIDEANSM